MTRLLLKGTLTTLAVAEVTMEEPRLEVKGVKEAELQTTGDLMAFTTPLLKVTLEDFEEVTLELTPALGQLDTAMASPVETP